MGTALFALYTPWVSSEVGWEDSAFFQLCHSTFGVPHGPGFPLYMLLGRLFALPFATAPAFGSNLLSVAAFAAAGVFLFEIMLLLGPPAESRFPRGLNMFAALTALAGWAMAPIHWSQVARTEVYTLALCLVLATCYAALRAHRDESRHRAACAAAWCWGLGMAVHPLIVATCATPWLFLAARACAGRRRTLVLFALLPMSLYLFPMLRGRIDGVWAWGDFSGLASSLDYFLRRTAWEAVVAVDGGFRENLAGWWSALPDLVPTLLWIPALWGLFLVRKFWLLPVTFALTGLLVVWAAPFDIANLDLLGYALPALAVLAAGAGVFAQRGVAFLRTRWPDLSKSRRLAFGACLVLLTAAWPVASLKGAAERGGATSGAGIITGSLDAALPQGATLLVNEDSFLGVLEYAQARGFRPDLHVISIASLRYPHYRRMLQRRFSDKITASWDVEEAWSDSRWRKEVAQLFSRREPGEPWFTQYERLPGLASDQLQPRGVVAALADDSPETSWEAGLAYWKGRVRAGVKSGPEQEALARWIFNFGVLSLDRGFTGVGWEALHLALEVSPSEPEMYFLLGRALERAGRVSESKALLAAAVEMAPYRRRYREALEGVEPTLAVQP